MQIIYEELKNMIDHCKRLNIGDKIKFKSEKQRYTVKAKSDRYIICTKPFNPKKTVLYTIIDLYHGIRGPNDLIFNIYDYSEQKDIDECIKDLEKNELEVSRRCMCLDVDLY